MIPYEKLTTTIPKGLREHLGVPIIRGNQTAPSPAYPFGSYTVTTIATANHGTWQKHPDGIDRKLVRSIWSLSFVSDDEDESVFLAVKARSWFEHTGRVWLAEHGVTVQSTTDIHNRGNLLTVEYERKNGFDVVLYVYDEVEDPANEYGHIESAEVAHEITN